MKSIVQPAETYKTLLLQCRAMRGKAGLQAFERAKILCRVFDDRDFRADLGSVDDLKAAKALDAECEDLCLSFLELRTLLQSRPDRTQWAEGKLATMYGQVQSEIRRQQEEDKPERVRRTATIKDLESIEKIKDEAISETRHIRSELDVARQRIAELESERQKLREEIANLKGRLAARELATA